MRHGDLLGQPDPHAHHHLLIGALKAIAELVHRGKPPAALSGQAANVYAQEFTRDELARLRELSRDPVLVKARERNKTIGPKLMALGAYTMRESEPELEAKIDRLVSDYLAKQPKGSDHS